MTYALASYARSPRQQEHERGKRHGSASPRDDEGDRPGRLRLSGRSGLREIEKPLVSDQDVLVRVRAASVNALDWHVVRGGPFLHMMAFLLRQPKINVRGVDVAGHVEAVGKNVTRLKPGDEVFGSARGAFAEYVAAKEDR